MYIENICVSQVNTIPLICRFKIGISMGYLKIHSQPKTQL